MGVSKVIVPAISGRIGAVDAQFVCAVASAAAFAAPAADRISRNACRIAVHADVAAFEFDVAAGGHAGDFAAAVAGVVGFEGDVVAQIAFAFGIEGFAGVGIGGVLRQFAGVYAAVAVVYFVFMFHAAVFGRP